MESFPMPFPVFFFDGEQEQDKGFVDIHSVPNFKRFQSLLSQKMGLPPNQLSTVFICRRSVMAGSEATWLRLPITVHTNFNIFLSEHNPHKERDSYFLVSLKKPKRERKGLRKWSGERDTRDDDWMRDKGHIDEILMDKNGSKGRVVDFQPSLNKSGSKMFEEGDNVKSDKIVILKRSSPPSFHRGGLKIDEELLSSQQYKSNNEILQQFQSLGSPFSDTRDYSPDFLTRNERSDLQAYSSMAALARAELEYRQNVLNGVNALNGFNYINGFTDVNALNAVNGFNGYSALNGFNGANGLNAFIPEEQSIFKGPSPESVYREMYRNKGCNWIYDMHKSRGTGNQFPKADVISANHWPHEKVTQFQHVVEGALPPDTINMYQKLENVQRLNYSSRSEHNNVKKDVSRCRICFDCKSDASPIPFHSCVEDAITKGHQGPSTAGHIGSHVHEIFGPPFHMRYANYSMI